MRHLDEGEREDLLHWCWKELSGSVRHRALCDEVNRLLTARPINDVGEAAALLYEQAPHTLDVAALVPLVKAEHPDWNPAQVYGRVFDLHAPATEED